nr:MAG TPA: vitamin B12-binding protein [Caudoviricetes sp.]
MKIRRLLLLAALLLAACAPTKQTIRGRTEFRTDSARSIHVAERIADMQTTQTATTLQQTEYSILRSVRTEPVPQRTARVNLTEENLRRLPDGASFTARDGQLTLEARRDGDTLRLLARCDSLSRRTEYFEATAARQSERIDSLERRLSEARQAYHLLTEIAFSDHTRTSEERTRTSSHRGWWFAFGLVAGCLGGWWARKTNLFEKLFKIF